MEESSRHQEHQAFDADHQGVQLRASVPMVAVQMVDTLGSIRSTLHSSLHWSGNQMSLLLVLSDNPYLRPTVATHPVVLV